IAGHDKMRKNVDIVVLSACETAVEKNRSSGKEFISISKAFATAGVPTLIATLWKINDASTKELFIEFYKNLKDKKQNKLDALHNAQLSHRNSEKYSHPFYWAPYLLIGDFR
ncbi:MAG: CHAT domain-containing protein, partial [bacterium]|nr:CHAT domain-containing protein [bacterium]